MKKYIVLLLMMMGTLAVHADSYTYLTFETTDGVKVSVEASSLTITISGTTLTAGSQPFTLSNLSKMYFSTSDETTSIDRIENGEWEMEDAATTIYDLQGRKVAKDDVYSGRVDIVKPESGARLCSITK